MKYNRQYNYIKYLLLLVFIVGVFFLKSVYASGVNDNLAEIKKINTIQAAKIKDLAKKKSVLENKLSAQQKKLQELENKFNASKPKIDSKELLKFNDRR